jgi:predicted CxxxxCH...CXXCH cytochrome family protein
VLSSVHDKHAGTAAGYVNSRGYSCSLCHLNADHNTPASTGGTIGSGAEWATKVQGNENNRVQVRFDLTWNPLTSNPAATDQDSTTYNDTTNTCANLYCHSPGTTGTTATWSGTLACTGCHGDTTLSMSTQSHGAHLQTSTGAGAVCANCHTAYTLNQAGTHADGAVTFAAGLTYTGNVADKVTANGLGTCGTNSCHNNGQLAAPLLGYTWGTAIGGGTNTCTECHGATSTTITTQAHNNHLLIGGPSYVTCTNCHAAASANTHADGTVTLGGSRGIVYGAAADVVVQANGGTFGSCSAGSCHNATAGTNIAWNLTQTNCNQCHYGTSDVNNWNGLDQTAAMMSAGEYTDRKSTRLNSSHNSESRMPSSA